MYKDKKVIHIVARDSNCGIGKDNSLMWNIPEDMKFFRDSTIGHVCLVGRKTAESFPKPLSRRLVIQVSETAKKFSNLTFDLKTALMVAFSNSNLLNTDKIFIAGGEQLYTSTFDIVDELWVTEVIGDFGADKYYHIPEGFHKFEFTDVMESVSGEKYKLTKWLRNKNFPF